MRTGGGGGAGVVDEDVSDVKSIEAMPVFQLGCEPTVVVPSLYSPATQTRVGTIGSVAAAP